MVVAVEAFQLGGSKHAAEVMTAGAAGCATAQTLDPAMGSCLLDGEEAVANMYPPEARP